jgi:hypothetical protein
MLALLDMLSCKSPSGAHRKPLKRLACGVAIALVGAMSIGASPLEDGQHDLTPKDYIRLILPKEQALCLIRLYGKESGFNPSAIGNIHGKEHTYGIPQLKNPIIALKSPIQQIDYGVKYVVHRYGDACQAWDHFKVKGWH